MALLRRRGASGAARLKPVRERVRSLAAPFVLIAVAVAQIAMVHALGLSPWLGGGFGMFSTIDSRSERHLVFFEELPGIRREIPLPEDLEERAARVRALPTPGRLRAIGEAVRARRADPRAPLRVQLLRTRFAPGTLAPETTLVREVRLDG